MRAFHPAANIFPLLDEAGLTALAANIAAHGLQVPIVIHDEMILEGRNRALACERAGVTPTERRWAGECGSPVLFVLALNIERRHLTESQRAMAGAESLPMLEAEARERQKALGKLGGRPPKAQTEETCGPRGPQVSSPPKPRKSAKRASKQAADTVQVSDRAVRRAKYVRDKSDALAEQVKKGEITLGAAEHTVRAAEKAAKAAELVAVVPSVDGRLTVGDAAEPWPIEPGSADLIFTSPPYGLDKPYHGITDEAASWPQFMRDWLGRAYDAAADTGRLALNVPLDTTKGGYRPTWPEACAAAIAAGWTYRTSIVWQKGNSTKGNRGLGSEDSADAPHPIAEVEIIGLFSKGAWKRATARPSDITHDEWQAWGDGVWQVASETRPWEGHPAPFAEELARRVIVYLSRVGDVIVDPFVGSGTTVLVAQQLKREAIGFDQSPDYVASASRRLAQWGEKVGRNGATPTTEQLGFDLPASLPG